MRRPAPVQCQHIQAALCRALGTICDGWDSAMEEAAARGYSQHSPGPRSVQRATGKSFWDQLNARTITPAKEGPSYREDDVTSSAALIPDFAGEWITQATLHLKVLLSASPADAVGESRWNGPWYPPALRSTFREAAEDLVRLWPMGCERLTQRIHMLANEAARRWPPKPKANEVIDGVKVGGRYVEAEVCTECGGPIAGGAADPIRRIDGRPFHKRPCFDTVRQRALRARKKVLDSPS